MVVHHYSCPIALLQTLILGFRQFFRFSLCCSWWLSIPQSPCPWFLSCTEVNQTCYCLLVNTFSTSSSSQFSLVSLFDLPTFSAASALCCTANFYVFFSPDGPPNALEHFLPITSAAFVLWRKGCMGKKEGAVLSVLWYSASYTLWSCRCLVVCRVSCAVRHVLFVHRRLVVCNISCYVLLVRRHLVVCSIYCYVLLVRRRL